MDVPKEWWRTFFTGAVVDSWLQAMPEEQTQAEADFIETMLQAPPPARLLDVPCGGGRHCLALAARGYHLTGVDLSADFLDAARSQAAARSATVRWEQRDMRDLPWPREFDGAYCFGNSFGYYEDDGNADFLRAVGRALKPGARFLLDASYITEILLPTLQTRNWYELGETVALADRHYDPATGRLYVEYTWIRDGRREKYAMSARLYSYGEVCRLLEGGGFTVVQGFGSLDQGPFRLGSERLLLVATQEGAPAGGS
ncbi:MAG: class I SAM-dependent methyltransferase [Gemmataceae bacterium]|nr:class I SAM-dependent methyltransferase [Gemmataceae bacterium]